MSEIKENPIIRRLCILVVFLVAFIGLAKSVDSVVGSLFAIAFWVVLFSVMRPSGSAPLKPGK